MKNVFIQSQYCVIELSVKCWHSYLETKVQGWAGYDVQRQMSYLCNSNRPYSYVWNPYQCPILCLWCTCSCMEGNGLLYNTNWMHICNKNSVDRTAREHFIYITTVGSFLTQLLQGFSSVRTKAEDKGKKSFETHSRWLLTSHSHLIKPEI